MQDKDVVILLSEWILERARVKDRSGFTSTTQIIDDGLLTSLDVVELILFIEDLRGEEVDVDALEPESFSNIETLMTVFFPARV